MKLNGSVPKASVKRSFILRIGIAISLAIVAVSMYVREPADLVFAASGELAAVYRDRTVEVNIPYDQHLASGGSIEVQIIDPADKALGSVHRSVSVSRSVDSWRVSIPLSDKVAIEDLAWDRLTVSGGGVSKTVSLSEVLLAPVIKFFGQSSYAAGSKAAVRVITVQDKLGTPLRDSRLKVELVDGDSSDTVFTGRTDALGTAQIAFEIPGGTFGPRKIKVIADTLLGHVEAVESIKI
ncbi:MAG TPA: hypothetical protein VI756_11130, partial [Blastocatellia bacterium]